MTRESEHSTILHITRQQDHVSSVEKRLADTLAVRTIVTRYDPGRVDGERIPADVDCVIAQHELTETTGLDLLSHVTRERPDLPTILYTSGGGEELERRATAAGVSAVAALDTPESARQITECVQATLTERANGGTIDTSVGVEPPPAPLGTRDGGEPFKRAVEHAGHTIVVTDVDGTIQYVNPAFEEMTGYSREEALGENPRILQSGEHDEEFYEDMWETILAGDVWTAEVVNEHKCGELYTVNQTIAPITDDEDRITGFVAVNDDITERKENERDLRRYKTAADAAYNGIAVLNRDLTFEFVNDTFVHSIGISRETLLSDTDLSMILDAGVIDKETYKRIYDATVAVFNGADRSRHLEYTITSPVAGELDLETYLRPISGELIDGVVFTIRDITERKRHERELERRNDRLEEFANVVSHDLRNPLNVAQGHLELARCESDSEHLTKIADAHGRMETLIENLLDLARDGDTIDERETVELRTITSEAWAGIETREARLVVETDCSILADGVRLRQLIGNLFRNAIEHGGPDITVTVGRTDDASGFYVADDGPGIPPDERDAIFENGYTTAEKGTGYGLSIVTRIVDAHGWDISVTDSQDGGARFEITGVDSTAE